MERESRGAVVELSGIRHTYRATTALDGIDLALPAGRMSGLIGPDGPVKSDDGEAGAGAIILRMLETAGLTGHLVVVTRWYGGKHLGGDRFRHVQEAVRLYLAEIGA